MTYAQVPPDLRKKEKQLPILYWTKRGRAIEISKRDGEEMLQSDRAWRRVTDEEIGRGVKAGTYNPIYDIGENKNAFSDIDINLPEEEGDTIECLVI